MGFKPMTSDTSAVLCQLSYQTNWELVTLWVRNIPVECDYAHEYTRIIYLNCGETYENMIDHRSSELKMIAVFLWKLWHSRFYSIKQVSEKVAAHPKLNNG